MTLIAEPANANPSPKRGSPTTDLLARLRDLVTHNSRRWKLLIILEAVGLAVSAPLAYLWIVFFLDNQIHLPLIGRLLASLGLLAGVAWAGTHLARRWRSIQLTEDQVALAIERQTPDKVHNRLINAVQIAKRSGQWSVVSDQKMQDDGASLTTAVIQENCERLRQIQLQQAAKMRPALLRLAIAVSLVFFGLGFWLFKPDQFTNAAERIFLPLADVDPLYRTSLVVDPGDVEGQGDITVHVHIRGERPKVLTIHKIMQGKRVAESVPVDAETGPVVYVFRDLTQSLDYSVSGGDFTSPIYHIEVPRKASFARLRVTYQYPEYTGLPAKTVETTTGNLEALFGTRAKVAFVFDQPLDTATLVLDSRRAGSVSDRRNLDKAGANEFSGEIVLEDVLGYHLEMTQGDQPKRRSAPFAIRILKDQEPKVDFTGLERRAEVDVDSVIPLQVTASDDFGLEKVGLFYRRAGEPSGNRGEDDGWQSIVVWSAGKKTNFKQSHELSVGALQIAEGAKIELVARAIDTDPQRHGTWTTGVAHELGIGGDGVALQLQYERIIRSEGELKAVLKTQQDMLAKVVSWGLKLDGGGDLRWDDPKNINALHMAIKELSKQQNELRKTSGQLARTMSPAAGNLPIALGLLADSEMDRAMRILDSVPGREQPQAKRAALADARVTQERILRSLDEFEEQYKSFRSDWELSNMIPFTKLLAERQTKMRDQARKLAGQSADKTPDFQRQSMSRRQTKMVELCTLIQPAFAGLATRLEDQEASLAKAFRAGATTLAGDALLKPMRQAGVEAIAGRWSEAAQEQTHAAEVLSALYNQLRKAQVEAAQKAIAALKEKAKSDLEAQKELEKLPPGTAEAMVTDFPENFKVEDLMRIREVVGTKKKPGNGTDEPDFKNSLLVDTDRNAINLQKDSGVRQDPYILQLGKVAEGTAVLNLPRDKEKNKVQPFIQEKFDDLVGKLLDEADELHKNYQTINLSTNQNNNDGGDIGKNGGTLNSTGAVAATGNKKPPTTDSGGVSRTGRQGARAHGMVADDEGVNRRGRDKALEGQEQVADQKGTIKMKNSDDMQKDTSTGVGGKKVESDDTHFSLADAGKWKDDMAKRMEKPQKKQYIVERQGDRMDPKVAAMLRDLTSKQEQVIERLKAIKKELKNLYLPTEHFDDLAGALEANLEALKDRPDPEMFRLQVQTLDRLRGTLRVFQGASAGFQPSLPRDRVIRGRVLDEPGAQALPGYEDAVRQYYLKLADQ